MQNIIYIIFCLSNVVIYTYIKIYSPLEEWNVKLFCKNMAKISTFKEIKIQINMQIRNYLCTLCCCFWK
ncbi:hypothetical protein AcetOrient_orf00619 [Acetobacter orientalis]|uniref:Uncharacterized protein n=1 Tax=Acetobacter orientalis TaxID=146474 RepID=A0A2Z5ZDN2_9PROT|nr:hypothetical protein AcetOrient_orf00619 [Acetobacter orientalis]